MNATDFENDEPQTEEADLTSIIPTSPATNFDNQDQSPFLYSESCPVNDQVALISGSAADDEVYRVNNDQAPGSVLHLAPDVQGGFVPIESQSELQLSDSNESIDRYRRGRRDSSLMCVDVLEPYQSNHEEPDLNQYFQSDPSVHFYQKADPSQPSIQFSDSCLDSQQANRRQTVAQHHQQVDITEQYQPNTGSWTDQRTAVDQMDAASEVSSGPIKDHYTNQQYFHATTPQSATDGYFGSSESDNKPSADQLISYTPDSEFIEQKHHTQNDRCDSQVDVAAGVVVDEKPHPQPQIGGNGQCELPGSGGNLQINGGRHSKQTIHYHGDHNDNVDINNNNIPNGNQENSYAIQQHQQYQNECQPESYVGVLIDTTTDHNALNYHTHNQRFLSNVAKYDPGGQVIEYRPGPIIPSYHQQYNTTFVDPIMTGTAFSTDPCARHTCYYSQHHISQRQHHLYHHQYHHQYQGIPITTTNTTLMETGEEAGKTYHLLGQNSGQSNYQQQQIAHSASNAYDHPYPEQSVDQNQFYKPLEIQHPSTYFHDVHTVHLSAEPTISMGPVVPGVSRLYDPNKEISSALLDQQDSEVGSIEGTSPNNFTKGGRGPRNTRNGASTQVKGSRCAPETIEKLRLFLERRKRAKEMNSESGDPNSSLDSSVEQATGLEYEGRSARSSSSCGGSGRSSPSSVNNSNRVAKISHITNTRGPKGTVLLSVYERQLTTTNEMDSSCLSTKASSLCSGSPTPSPNCSFDEMSNSNHALSFETNQNRFLETEGLKYEPDAATCERRQLRSRTIVLSKRS